jgi:hypothetical protein
MHHVNPWLPPDLSRCGSRRHLDEPCVPTVRPGYLLCDTCLEGVENALVDLPDWYAERVRSAGEHGRGMRADVVQVASDSVEVLSSWCGVVVAQRGVPAPEPSTITLLAGFLAVHLQWLTSRSTAGEFADDLMFIDQAMRRVVRPEAALSAPLGPCPWPGCGEQLYATARQSAEDRQVGCVAGHRWPPNQWLTSIREPLDVEKRDDDQNPADDGSKEVA